MSEFIASIDALWPVLVRAWAGDEEAQQALAPLPIWLTRGVPIDGLTGDAKDKWQELSAEIGYICNAWNNIDHGLDFLFSSVLKINISVAQVIFSTIISNKTKRDLLLNVSVLVIYSEAHLKKMERLLARIGKAAKNRNFIVHGVAGMSNKSPGLITIQGKSPEMKPALMHYVAYAHFALQDFRRELEDIALEVQSFASVIDRARRRPSHEIRARSLDEPWEIANNRQRVRPAKPKAPPQTSRALQTKGPPSRGKPPHEKPSSAQRREEALARAAQAKPKKDS